MPLGSTELEFSLVASGMAVFEIQILSVLRVLPAWEMMSKPVPSISVKDLIIQKTKQETPNIKKIKQTFKFNVCLEYNVHLENVSPSEVCEIWEIIGESFQVKKNIITTFSYLCLCSNTDTQKFLGSIATNLRV